MEGANENTQMIIKLSRAVVLWNSEQSTMGVQ